MGWVSCEADLGSCGMCPSALSGVSRAHFGELFTELAGPWEAARQSALRAARGGERKRAEGAGRKPKLVFFDRLLVTLVHLRHQLPHEVLAELFAVDRSSLRGDSPGPPAAGGTWFRRARPAGPTAEDPGGSLRLCRGRGRRAAARRGRDPGPPPAGRTARAPRVRLRQTQAEHHQDHHVQRRPGPHAAVRRGPARPNARPDRRAHRGHRRTVPYPADCESQGRLRLPGAGQGFPSQVSAPPKRPKDEACDGDRYAWREMRRRQSSARICVEHTNAELRQCAPLRRFTGRRDTYAETHLAIAGLISDRSAQRATRRRTSTELVPVRDTTC